MDKVASAIDSTKKRKIFREDEEEEDEEAKMEAFFALVRNIRDTRDRWMGLRSSQSDSASNKRGKIIITTAKEEEEEENNRVWKPTFQLEDFVDELARPGNSAASQIKTCAKEDDAEKGIDLSLSL